ncbi:lipopolysaccharide-binding protein-like isoform X2 [Mytilus californianus]|uniref:lipopolysaccharide-binding protein-like isoform X2 n=1 Tax=Mytilus californianus TaxID=6549 RepID=UPI002246B8F4|nr:lipopolysaccharide-binding protein-like isoform X2 [Mytilus californianus]
MWLLFIFSLFIFSKGLLAKNPGFRLQITQNGINIVNTVAADLLSKNVNTMKISKQTGRDINVNYELRDIKIKKFQLGKSSFTRYTENSLRWTAEKIDLDIDGQYQYEYSRFFVKHSDKGSFTVNFSTMSFKIIIQLGTDGSGRPTVRAYQCLHTYGPIKYVFHGGKDWIFKLFAEKAIQGIRNQFQNNLCGILKDLVEKNAQRIVSNVKVRIPLGNSMMVDYRLPSIPSVSTNYLEVHLKGTVLWRNSQNEAPYSAASFPSNYDTTKMAYIAISDYLFNTMIFQAYRHNMLVFNITSTNIGCRKSMLNTTCSDKCIGKLIPQIAKSFPNSSVELHMMSTKQPVTNINGIVSVTAEGNISVYVRKLDNSRQYLFRVSAVGGSKVNPRLNDRMLYGQLARSEIQTNVTDSVIGAIDIYNISSLNRKKHYNFWQMTF